MLAGNQAYEDIKDQLKELRDLKKTIEHEAQAEMGADYDKLDELKQDIASDQEMLADIALTQYANGEEVVVTDRDESEYEPVFSVRFKKV